MESSTEKAKITDSGYSNSSSENRHLQESNGSMPQSTSKKFKKKQKNLEKTSPSNVESLSEATTLSTSLNKFFLKKSGEQAIAEMMDIANSRGNNNVMVSVDKTGVRQINSLADYNFQMLEDFFSVISMSDGLVVFTTPNLYEALGFPEGDTDRRCFIDFIHPSDRETFFNHINKIYSEAKKEFYEGESQSQVTLFCRLKRRNVESNLENGNKKMIQSKPFHLTLYIKDLQNYMKEELLNTTFLVVMAQVVHSAYKGGAEAFSFRLFTEPEEYIKSKIFSTLHTTTCQMSHVDSDVVQYFGYLPQDMIGCSFFDFCHPEDLHIIKESYETVLRRSESSFKSQPYRFIIKNGDFLVLETMFSTYTNPWSKKLESVQGLHRVIKGPMNIDIFDVSDEPTIYSEDVLTKAKLLQKEILILLQKGVQKNQPAESKNYEYLEPVILNLLHEFQSLQSDKGTGLDNRSFSMYKIAVPRECSPHRELKDSISSTETMPSYHQLNFNENVDRFFNSNLEITATYGNEENRNENSGDEPGKSSEDSSENKCTPENGESELNGSLQSAENLRNNFKNKLDLETTSTGTGMKNYLTESLITQHDEKMKNILIQKYKEIRLNMKNSDKQKKSILKPTAMETEVPKTQGEKRCRSESEELDDEKTPEQFFVVDTNGMLIKKNKVMKFNHSNTLTPVQNHVNPNVWQPEGQNLCLMNNRDQNSAPLPVSQDMIQHNMNYVRESSMETRSQQQNENSPESSTSSFYSSFLSKSSDRTSDDVQQRSNEESELEVSFDIKQEDNPNLKNTKNPSPGRQFIGSIDSHDTQVQMWWKNQQDAQLTEKKPCQKMLMKEPSCMENIQTTSELTTQYQEQQKSLVEILQYDSESLKEMIQPSLINEQLNQLYWDLEAQNLKVKLNIEELEDYDGKMDKFHRIETS